MCEKMDNSEQKNQKIQPSAITKPIQLLGAWLVGLLTIDSSFLIAASRFHEGGHEVTALVWAAILNVPLFIGALFLLQTRFRPELQEDLYYSTYINQKTNQKVSLSKADPKDSLISVQIDRLETLTRDLETVANASEKAEIVDNSSPAKLFHGINRHLKDGDKIRNRLEQIGTSLITTFGPDEPPDHRVVAIAGSLGRLSRLSVLKLAYELGFERYSIITPDEEIDEDVLWGAYGTDTELIPVFSS